MSRLYGYRNSDFHKLTVKAYFRKKSPKVIEHRNYKRFSHTKFRNELGCFLNRVNLYNISNDDFVTTFMDILNKHAPLKQKYIRANNNPFVTKELRKEHMLRSRLRNKYYKDKTDASALPYTKSKEINVFPFLKKTRNPILEI